MTEENPSMRLPVRTARTPQHHRLKYRLNCGREVFVEECHISVSTLGYLAGSKDAIRADIIRRLPARVFDQFPGHGGFLIKPVPQGELPGYQFIVALVCYQTVPDSNSDFSSLVVCWLGDDIETSLPELIAHEICSIEWDEYATDGNF